MSESLNRQLADLHAERVATWAPEALQVNIDQRQRLVDEARPDDYVQVGDELASFTLLTVEGGELNRDLLLADGPAVLIFFRFAGCPACNIALPYYERQLYPRLRELGVPLVAVSPQVPERLVEIKTRHTLQLQVASDPDNTLGRRLGILYSADEASRNAALAKGNHLGETTGTGTWELPQPTVVVIAGDGTVAFVEVSPDWLVRTEAEPVLQAVERLLGEQPVRIAI
ncbi:peroxiredoxin-like family protein [Pseudomonas sp. OV546]|uniref:peroxiredoxin-like family protein n=1 Tax=Pseudomonas sp. OV546 TaxID=1881063 RepID=UPI0008E3BC5A|nr:peroxiredoxin-like family protein [Pseudomonas sp. OV546]SFU45138.1 Peroxiredoxin [Pseudomonas sp. OV546]